MKDNFHSARLRLTAWYLLIIMVISIFFSAAFYQAATSELERVIDRIQFRQQFPQEEVPNRPPHRNNPNMPTLEELEQTKNRLLITLIMINGAIFIIAGGAGYFLAGRTLRPIKLMIDEQNQFITSSSHELRTPIATLRAEMEGSLLEKHISDKKARKLVMSNLEELGGIQSLTNNLLKLAQIHNSNNITNSEEFSLREVIQTAQKKVTPLAKQKTISFAVDVHDAVIKGDKGRIAEMFIILFDNAIKYSPEKTVITVSSEIGRNAAVIRVVDQGIGIAKEDLPHIFDRFYRVDSARSQTEGFGLGLSIAKKIVESHNGSIHVASKLTKGTTFTLHIPTNNN